MLKQAHPHDILSFWMPKIRLAPVLAVSGPHRFMYVYTYIYIYYIYIHMLITIQCVYIYIYVVVEII